MGRIQEGYVYIDVSGCVCAPVCICHRLGVWIWTMYVRVDGWRCCHVMYRCTRVPTPGVVTLRVLFISLRFSYILYLISCIVPSSRISITELSSWLACNRWTYRAHTEPTILLHTTLTTHIYIHMLNDHVLY